MSVIFRMSWLWNIILFFFYFYLLPQRASSIFIALVYLRLCSLEIIKKKRIRSAISSVIFTSAAGHCEYMANVLYEMGMNQLRSGDVKLAFRNFSKFLALAKKISDPEGICNAHMAMALVYKLCIMRLYFPRVTVERGDIKRNDNFVSFDLHFTVARLFEFRKTPIPGAVLTRVSRL